MFYGIQQWADYKKFRASICRAFPTERHTDVEAVLDALSWKTDAYSGEYEAGEMRFELLSGEAVRIPYRIYLASDQIDQSKLTMEQIWIYHCLFTRSHDGYRRQAHIGALLWGEVPDWCFPFFLMEGGDYVIEVLAELYSGLSRQDTGLLESFCRRNMQALLYLYARMLSYWDVFYKNTWDPTGGAIYENLQNYVGKELFVQCFGYRRGMEKQRKRYIWRED